MIYGYIPKSKPKKLSKVQQEQKAEWLAAINKLFVKTVFQFSHYKKEIAIKTYGFFS